VKKLKKSEIRFSKLLIIKKVFLRFSEILNFFTASDALLFFANCYSYFLLLCYIRTPSNGKGAG